MNFKTDVSNLTNLQLLSVVVLLNLSCTNSSKVEATYTRNTSVSVQTNKPKIDTIYKEIDDLIPFEHGYSFGMTLSDWNKAVALNTKNGKYERIDEGGTFSSYQAYHGSRSENQSYSIKANFILNYFSGNVYNISKVKAVIQNDPLLSEIEYTYYTDDPNEINKLTNSIIDNFNLSFLTGKKPIYLDNTAPDINLVRWEDVVDAASNRVDLSFRTNEKTFKINSTSLFENELFYVVIYISEYKECKISRGSEAKILSVQPISTSGEFRYKVCSKNFSRLDPKDFMT